VQADLPVPQVGAQADEHEAAARFGVH
jgi:hypothetical protein